MGVAIDTYDKESGIHPRNKQLTTKRLAVAGLNVAYGLTDYPTNGPYPEVWNFVELEDEIQVDILYDKTFHWNVLESEGFYVCCLDSDFDGTIIEACANAWVKVMIKPNYFKKQSSWHHFYLPKVIIQVQTGLEYSAMTQ